MQIYVMYIIMISLAYTRNSVTLFINPQDFRQFLVCKNFEPVFFKLLFSKFYVNTWNESKRRSKLKSHHVEKYYDVVITEIEVPIGMSFLPS